MKTAEILSLFDYNYWANARILRAALELTPDEFVQANRSSYGSLCGTLVHTLFAETIWRRRLQGESTPTGLPAEIDFPEPRMLQDAWMAEEKLMRAYLAGLSDADLQSTLHSKNTKGMLFQNVVWNILLHIINHGTQHRAEAAAMLTDFGHSPGDIDMIIYFREKGALT